MKRNKEQARQGIRNIKEVRKLYDKGLKIYSPGGQLIFTLKPGDSVDYRELIQQGRRKSRYRGYNEYKGKQT